MYDQSQIATPVAFLIFNRPDTTQRVFEAIARARPRKLLVVADGPRDGHPTDHANCREARAIVEKVDWPCEVLKDYSEVNLGCRKRVSSGLDWVFSQVEEAIILEDDCLPSQSFFPFCEDLLFRYRDDARIMHISGNNFQKGMRRSTYSYYFSRIAHIWGWATWRRAWAKYDVQMKSWPQTRADCLLKGLFQRPAQRAFWETTFNQVHDGHVNTWDAQWAYTCLLSGGMALLPEVNLVTNIGAGPDATHTTDDTWYLGLPSHEIGDISHPPRVVWNRDADDFTMRCVFGCEDALPKWSVQRLRRVPSGLKRRFLTVARSLVGLARDRLATLTIGKRESRK